MRSRRPWLLALLVTLAAASPSPAQPPTASPPAKNPEDLRAEAIRSKFTKYEVRIPMRDGVKLFTSIYVPNDAGLTGAKTYPMLMQRTPYSVGPYGLDDYKTRLGQTEAFEKEGFIFVYQDVRGRYLSEGTFDNMRPALPVAARKPGGKATDEATDTWDTIEWLVKNVPGNNGKVGMLGVSYPGFYTSYGAIDSHPALKAVSPQAPIADWFWDDMHRHGAFNLMLTFNFFSTFGRPRPEPTTENPERFDFRTNDGYRFFLDLGPLANVDKQYFQGDVAFWNDIVAHPNYDAFWQSRNLLPHLQNVRAAVLTVGGWFDTEDLYGPLQTYQSIERQNPKADNVLMMGPWCHGCWARGEGNKLGDTDFGFKTGETYGDLALRFFVHHLKGGPDPNLPEAMMFETGANRWRRFETWPPKAATKRTLYLQAGGKLSFEKPAAREEAADDFPSDPAKPVPYTTEIMTRWSRDYMAADQRFAATRPDVLVYESEPLTEDLTFAGPLEADLWVSTTGSDADWVVKLIDVHPPGKRSDEDDERKVVDRRDQQLLVRGEPFRGRFRESYETPKAFTPGEVTRVRFRINDVLHTFQRGHRVMIQIQSSWFPFIDRNPQTFVPNIFEAAASDFVKATHRVYRSEVYPSGLTVGVLPPAP